jgi:hypothetical protein
MDIAAIYPDYLWSCDMPDVCPGGEGYSQVALLWSDCRARDRTC